MTDAGISYVVTSIGDSKFSVTKYMGASSMVSYDVGPDSCSCPGFKSRSSRGSVRKACKHISMVMKFDPGSINKFSSSFRGASDTEAQKAYEDVAKGVSPFVDDIALQELVRNPITDGVTGLVVRARRKRSGDGVGMKLTGQISSMMVTLIIV